MSENLKPKTNPALMRLAAERAGSKPEFLGYLLNFYRANKKLDWPELASQLGASEETLSFLYMCRAPATDDEIGKVYRDYIQNISRGLEVDQTKLSSVIRTAMNIQRLRKKQQDSSEGDLKIVTEVAARTIRTALAARDRYDEDDSETDMAQPEGNPAWPFDEKGNQQEETEK